MWKTLPFTLGSFNVIHRLKWLLAMRHTNFVLDTLTLRIPMDGKIVVLKEDPSLSKSMVSLKMLVKTLQQESQGMMVKLGCMAQQVEEMEGKKRRNSYKGPGGA